MHQLGEAINNAVMASTDVDAALDKVRGEGIDVVLVVEATICVRRRDGESIDIAPQTSTELELVEDVQEFETPKDFSSEDRQFLKRLRIMLDTES